MTRRILSVSDLVERFGEETVREFALMLVDVDWQEWFEYRMKVAGLDK